MLSIVRFSFYVHRRETDIESVSLFHNGAPHKPTGGSISLRTRLVGTLAERGVIGKKTVLKPERIVINRVHDADTASRLIDVRFRFVHVFFLCRAVSRRQAERYGIMSRTHKVVLLKTILQISIFQRYHIVRKADITPHRPLPVRSLESDTHVAHGNTFVHFPYLLLGSIILGIRSCIEQSASG